jgi:PAS domain S-box-containing protein
MNKPVRILQLEGTPADAELNERELRNGGINFTSLRVDTRVAFESALDSFHPDLILADYNLPNFNGMQGLAIARQRAPDVPYIFVTGAMGDEISAEAIKQGASDYLLKDRLGRLSTSVLQALENKRLEVQSHRNKEDLFNSELRLRTIFETEPECIKILDNCGRLLEMNPAGLAMLEADSLEEAQQKSLVDYVDPESRDAFISLHRKVMNGESGIFEFRITGLKGTPRWLETHAVPMCDANGKVEFLLGVTRDITEHKRADATIRTSRDLLRSVVENTPMRVFWKDRELRYLGCNTAFARDAGMSHPQELYGKDDFQLGWREQAELYRADDKLVMDSGIPVLGREEPQTTPDGQTIWLRTSKVPLRDAEGMINGVLGMYEDITVHKLAEVKLEHSIRALATLSEVNRHLVHVGDEQGLLSAICQTIVSQQGYRMAWVGYLEQDEAKTIRPVAKAGFEDGYLESIGSIVWADTSGGLGPASKAARSGEVQIAQDIRNSGILIPRQNEAIRRGYASIIALPLVIEGKVFGVMSIYSEHADSFNPEESRLLEEMAGDLAFGINTLHVRQERDLAQQQIREHLAKLQENLDDTVKAISTIVEMRDPYTAGHETRVAELAVVIAKEMGLPDDQIRGLHLAGEVHDLGKVQIPAEILSKPGKLNQIEYNLVKVHPQAGYDILKGIDFPWPIAQMVLQHHERLDGSGYPQGLKGDAILLEARILCVADVVEAMSSHRPYRPELGIDSALDEIKRGSGSIYDPAVAEACLKVFAAGNFRL